MADNLCIVASLAIIICSISYRGSCCGDLDIGEILKNATLEAQETSRTVEKKEDESTEALEVHNLIRKMEHAANMNKLVWDDTLAAMAKNYAAMCSFSHGQPKEPVSPYPDVGQNMYITSFKNMNYTATVWSWYGENKYYDFATQACSGKTCGHYTQLVWADSILLGCGYHYCTSPIAGTFLKEGYLVVCNYVPPGNFPDEDPYMKGEPCSKCSDSCEDGLCITEY